MNNITVDLTDFDKGLQTLADDLDFGNSNMPEAQKKAMLLTFLNTVLMS